MTAPVGREHLAAPHSMSLEQGTLERISGDFQKSDVALVVELLSGYSGPEAAQTDYRDVLYWAEYFDTDPTLRDRDPKKMVDDVISKWGNRK